MTRNSPTRINNLYEVMDGAGGLDPDGLGEAVV